MDCGSHSGRSGRRAINERGPPARASAAPRAGTLVALGRSGTTHGPSSRRRAPERHTSGERPVRGGPFLLETVEAGRARPVTGRDGLVPGAQARGDGHSIGAPGFEPGTSPGGWGPSPCAGARPGGEGTQMGRPDLNRGPHRAGGSVSRRGRDREGSSIGAPGFEPGTSPGGRGRSPCAARDREGKGAQSGRPDLNRGPHRVGGDGLPARRATARGGNSIGAPGFEPGTSPTRTVRATRLRHAPREPQCS